MYEKKCTSFPKFRMKGPETVFVPSNVYIAVESPTRDHNQMPQSGSMNCRSMTTGSCTYTHQCQRTLHSELI